MNKVKSVGYYNITN